MFPHDNRYLYVKVSSDELAIKGHALAFQEERLKNFVLLTISIY